VQQVLLLTMITIPSKDFLMLIIESDVMIGSTVLSTRAQTIDMLIHQSIQTFKLSGGYYHV